MLRTAFAKSCKATEMQNVEWLSEDKSFKQNAANGRVQL